MSSEARENETGQVKLSDLEYRLLKACCACADDKGVPVGREWRRTANSLVRKGLAWTCTSLFTVCLATDRGRKLMKLKATGEQA